MTYTLGQRFGRLTVTQLDRGSVVTRLRCDCGTQIPTRLEYSVPAPVGEIGDYHARYLAAAEAGRLRYDHTAYPIHALPPNAADALWRGLLADAPGGPVLTELGAHLLEHWRERRPAAAPPSGAAPAVPARRPASRQLDLFSEVS